MYCQEHGRMPGVALPLELGASEPAAEGHTECGRPPACAISVQQVPACAGFCGSCTGGASGDGPHCSSPPMLNATERGGCGAVLQSYLRRCSHLPTRRPPQDTAALVGAAHGQDRAAGPAAAAQLYSLFWRAVEALVRPQSAQAGRGTHRMAAARLPVWLRDCCVLPLLARGLSAACVLGLQNPGASK